MGAEHRRPGAVLISDTDLLAIGATVAIGLLAAVAVGRSRLPRPAKLVIQAGIALHFAGAWLRQAMAADASVYYRWGARYAEYFSRLDFSPLYDPALWRGDSWIGTNFVAYPVGFVISLLGPSWTGTFFAFGLLSLIGLACYAAAYRRALPGASPVGYCAWLFLLPSLWFWPSSIGKEAVMLVGLGVATLGFVGREGRINWLLMLLGLALVFCVRPAVVAVFGLAMVLSHWLQFRRWTLARLVQGVLILAVGVVGIWYAVATTLAAEVDVTNLQEYVGRTSIVSLQGGSSIAPVGADPRGIPVAIVNVLFRPFIWEAHNATALVSALEVLAVIVVVVLRRGALLTALRRWRSERILRFAVPFTFLYVVALGMSLSNLGLIARQRILVFPLLFLIVEAGLHLQGRAMTRTAPVLRPARRPVHTTAA